MPIDGQKIRRIADAHAMTLQEVAARAGMTPQALSRLLRGNVSPRLATVEAIAGALGVEVGELLSEKA